MAKNKCIANSYEEARKQRLEENRKRFEDLGIAKISKSLTELSNSTKKTLEQRPSKPRQKTIHTIEPRRSSRVRNSVPLYRDYLDIELPRTLRGSRSNSSWASYVARPLDECKTASYEERAQAFKLAENFQSQLQSGNPSFVKSMGLPTKFCADYLSEKTVEMVLEDEEGQEYDATFIGKRTGLSGGWRGFALDHKLDDGDALVFELVEPIRFKVYMFRVSSLATGKTRGREGDEPCGGARKKVKAMKSESQSDETGNKEDNKSGDSTSGKREAQADEDTGAGVGSKSSSRKAAPRLSTTRNNETPYQLRKRA